MTGQRINAGQSTTLQFNINEIFKHFYAVNARGKAVMIISALILSLRNIIVSVV